MINDDSAAPQDSGILPPQATPDEVLIYLTAVMRGEKSGAQSAMKAAELLGKRFGLFLEQPGAQDVPILLDDIGARDSCA